MFAARAAIPRSLGAAVLARPAQASCRSLAARTVAASQVPLLHVGRRTLSTGSSAKVAILQDQQIPKEQAIQAVESSGFEVAWALDQPSDAWAIVTVTTPVTEEVLDKHPNCKVVAVSFTGFNHVDLEACKKRGISVVNVPAYSTDAVAVVHWPSALGLQGDPRRREDPAQRRLGALGGRLRDS
jgi:hypothetical protein